MIAEGQVNLGAFHFSILEYWCVHNSEALGSVMVQHGEVLEGRILLGSDRRRWRIYTGCKIANVVD